jgi:exopolysaccharide biosynthesis polyprenyl glycosylphosphotransferase
MYQAATVAIPEARAPIARPLPPRAAAAPLAHRRASRLVPAAALPLADLAAVTLAAIMIGPLDWAVAGYALAMVAALAACGQQRLRICLRVSDQVGRIVGAAALPLLIVLPWLPEGDALRLALLSAALVTAIRAALYLALRAAHRHGVLTERTLVVGTGAVGTEVASLLSAHPEFGLRPCGFLTGAAPPADGAGTPLPVLGDPADLIDVVGQWRIRRVIVSALDGRDEDLVPALHAARRLGTDVCMVPRLSELGLAIPRSSLDEVWGIPLIPLRRGGPASAGRILKRAVDVLAATVLLAVAAPVLLVLAAVIRLRSGGPALFRQLRVTGGGRLASIVKLRTLGEHSDPDTRWAVPIQQCGAFGRWLRATHLDELPQLLNVLRGEMSLVGPRPERPYFARRFARTIPHYDHRHRMRAGITGWAQVHGLHGDTSIRERARFDNQYIEYWSPWLDLVIMARTCTSAVTGAWRGKPGHTGLPRGDVAPAGSTIAQVLPGGRR